MTRYILSVDGGGIRGIIPAGILSEIEKRTQKPIAEIFDLMVGSSTGGIIVAGLGRKRKPRYTANDLVDLYKENGAYIFKSSWLRSIRSWYDCAQYPHKNIEFVLDRYFGDDRLHDTITNLMITSYDVVNNTPIFFKSWKHGYNIIKLKDALRAATAAPTLFIPKSLTINGVDRLLVDGGVFANNPAACAYVSSRMLFPNDDIVILSVGTGRVDRSNEYADSHKFGKISWAKTALNLMLTSSVDVVNYQLKEIMGDKYIRLQSHLTIAAHAYDDSSPENIDALLEEVNIAVKVNNKLVDQFCKAVS